MKKSFVCICILVLLPIFLLAGSITYTFNFSSEDINFTTYNGYDVLTIRDGVSNTEVGSPSIPFIVANFVIPSGAKVREVNVISKETEDIHGAYDICPVQTPRPISTKEDIPFVEPDPSIYNSDNPYPESDIVSFSSGSMSGFRIAGIFVNPLVYIPNEKRLILTTEIAVRIEYTEGVHEVISLTEKQREVFAKSVNTIVLNPDDIKRFSPPHRQNPMRACEFAIITGSRYTSDFQRLAYLKTAAGYSAQVFSTDWIYSNYSGYDDPERIRNFLKDYFTNQGLIYAVLGGDVHIVPERVAKGYYNAPSQASDYYYADLDGTWDANGNHQYGEISVDGVDGYFDIYVGRPPIDNSIDINSFLIKDSVYIYCPDDAAIQKLLLPSAMLWSYYGYHGRVTNNKIGAKFPSWTVTKLEDAAGYSPNTRNAFNENYNLMNIASHGNESGFYSEGGNSIITTSDVQYLTNTMPTILNSFACYPGDFDEGECFAEHIMNKSDGAGCVACVLNSRNGWGTPPSMGPSEQLDTTFFSIMVKDTIHIGITHGAVKNHFRNVIWSDALWHDCGVEINLFGDPEMSVHLNPLNKPYVDISDKVLFETNSNETWEPGEYAELTVTLLNGGSVIANNVQAVLRATINGQYVNISDSVSSFGNISAGNSADNASDPYKITAVSSTPSGTVIEFTLHITANGGYSWDPKFTYVVARPLFDHDVGNVLFTVSNRGICGFIDDTQGQGSGFHYPKAGGQHLYIGSVWAGNSAGYMVNRDYSAENAGDWQSLHGMIGKGAFVSEQDSWAKYGDLGHPSPKGLTCLQDGWAWSDPGHEDYVIMRYIFKNEGLYTQNALYFGQFMDWNVGVEDSNSGGVDTTRNLVYQYGAGTEFVGVGLLDPVPAKNLTFINNPQYVDPNGFIADIFKVYFMQGILSNQDPTPWDDWSVCVSAGPFIINPEDSSIFAVTILGGESVSDIQENYDSAWVRYHDQLGVEKETAITPELNTFAISKIYPQPFSSVVNIEYSVPEASKISLRIYDVTGRLVRTIVFTEQSPGIYRAMWDGKKSSGKKAASGVYFCQLLMNGNEKKTTRKLLLVR